MKIEARGILKRLGSDDPQAAPEERPGWTRFEHDFWMDSCEVTQREFQALTGRNPSVVKGDDLPVNNVTWFDAVLAANARSKRDGLDTVYDYSSSRRDGDGSVVDLGGLSIHHQRDGWRLPTEAEWELAARAGSDSPYPWGTLADSSKARLQAWYQANSGGAVHPVGSLAPNAWGFHDMAGNVMEWVQDWKGPFPKDTLPDFAGQAFPGEVADIPVKGGASKFGITYLRPSNRTATYASGREARTEYVGFRLARGGMRPSFLDRTGAALQIPSVALASSSVAGTTAMQAVRLVFINRSAGKGTLAWVDYVEPNPMVRYLPDSLPVFHPAISPDGNWVAWSTALEGSTSASRVRVRRLTSGPSTTLDLGEGAIPRWWVDGSDTFLIRAQAMDNLSSSWPASKTTMRRWSAGSLESVETTLSDGSFHDGRSGHFLYTGYRRLIQRNLTTGTDRILFTAPANGKLSGDTSQVCNVSTAPDGSGMVMFLDFGFSGWSSVVGRPYGIHEIAFLADSTGKIVKTIPAPTGERQWEHLEWSNHPSWAVASVQNGSGANHAVHLVDLKTGTSSILATGEDLWHPALWVNSGSFKYGVDPYDSAGRYLEPPGNMVMSYLGPNLLRFWKSADSLQVVAVGSSHLIGLLPVHFPTHKALSLSFPGSSLSDEERIIRSIVVPNAPSLKAVVVSFMPGWFFPLVEPSLIGHWEKMISGNKGIAFDSSHGFWNGGRPKGFIEAIQGRMLEYGIAPSQVDETSVGRHWGGAAPEIYLPQSEDMGHPVFRQNMDRLRRIVKTTTDRGIHLVVVSEPQSPEYAKTASAGKYGPSWQTYHALIDTMRQMESDNHFFHFYDAFLDGKHDYPDEEALDADHLWGKGYVRLGSRLDSIVSRLP